MIKKNHWSSYVMYALLILGILLNNPYVMIAATLGILICFILIKIKPKNKADESINKKIYK